MYNHLGYTIKAKAAKAYCSLRLSTKGKAIGSPKSLN